MKIAVCNTYYNKGGAARAAQRIFQSLRLIGEEVSFVSIDDPSIKKNRSLFFKGTKPFWSRLEQYPKLFKSKNFSVPFSTSKYSLNYLKYLNEIDPDIVHLHYINNGLFSIKDIGGIKQPIVWTLHESWAFTGGCHMPMECEKYKKKCGNCPIIAKGKENDLSRYVWEMKNKYWDDVNITIVSPSEWLAERAKQSSLFRDKKVEVISNPLDTKLFKPLEKSSAREQLGLENDKKYILFGAVNAFRDKNKGFDLLKEALGNIKINDVELVVFGCDKDIEIDVNIPTKNMGFIYDDKKLAKIYSACDVTVIPSRSENQPNIAIESMACGTPVVGFDIEGVQEVLKNTDFGKTARAFESMELKKEIEDLLESKFNREEIARYIQENFNMEDVGKKYQNLFSSINF